MSEIRQYPLDLGGPGDPSSFAEADARIFKDLDLGRLKCLHDFYPGSRLFIHHVESETS